LLYSLAGKTDLTRIAAELLTQTHGSSILQMGAADFDNVIELPALRGKFPFQVTSQRQETVTETLGCGQMDGRGDNVIARLAAIYMIIGMYR
jgi:hypothetical protein